MSFLIPSPPPDASGTRRGLVSTVAQTFGGLKTFLHGLKTSKIVFGDDTEMTTAPVEASLESVGTGQSLVNDGAGPAMVVKSMKGTGVATVTATATEVNVHVPAPAAPSLSDSGPGHSLIKSAMALKRLVQGSGVVLTPTAEGIEVAAAATAPVTLGSTAGGYSLVSGGTGPNLEIRAIDIGAGLQAAFASGRLVISLDETDWLLCPIPSYWVQRRTRERVPPDNEWGPWSGWSNWEQRTFWRQWNGTQFRVKRAGRSVTAAGILGRTAASQALPVNTISAEYQWAPGTPNFPGRFLGWWPDASVWWPAINFRPRYSANSTTGNDGLHIYTAGIHMESGTAPDTHPLDSWVAWGGTWNLI